MGLETAEAVGGLQNAVPNAPCVVFQTAGRIANQPFGFVRVVQFPGPAQRPADTQCRSIDLLDKHLAGGDHAASDATEDGTGGMRDADVDRDRIPVLAARIAQRRASHRTAHKGLLGQLGPGLITGASDDDPSGIATYSQTGAQFGYAMCWVMLFCFPLMVAI